MKQRTILTLLAPVFLYGASMNILAAPTPAEVKAITKRVADWQIKTFEDHVEYRAIATSKQEELDRYAKDPSYKISSYDKGFLANWHDLDWHNAALYVGVDQWRTIADDPAPYNDFLKMIGERNDWKLHKRRYHADDHAVGQFYLSLYEDFNDKDMLYPTRDRFDWIMKNPKTGSLEWKKGTDVHRRWGWCDALFMAPPVWTRLAKITGEKEYLEFMDQEYHASYDLLWDQEEHLFFRDTRYFTRFEENGAKLFWSRGNGWVFGGLALMIPDMPAAWEGRPFYIDLYQQMAIKLKSLQRKDGTWSMGLLGGTDGYPLMETSGTSFFTFGLAWGVNNGLLDRATYEPIIFKAWNALAECVTAEGLVGYVQPVGAAPGDSYADKTEVYGIGAFLAAGTEVYKMIAGNSSPSPEAVKQTMKRVADWQLENLRSDCYKRKREHNNDLHAWTYGACFVGLDKWAAMAGDEKYYDALLDLGPELDWELGKRIYHADDHLVGRLYMQLAEINNEPAMYAKTKARLDFIIANPSKQPVTIKGMQQERWTWCDALFMSPPIWAQMSRLTGDSKYLNFMVKEYKATYDHLYDPETKLFFRDANYFKRRDDGRKVFWSRGNGWVFGGLALIIDELPEGKDRDWFVALFKDMAPSIAKLQTPAGHWAMSLLYADKYPTPETSGSSFFIYGLAWGINQGFLDQAMYEPVVMKGWNALVGHVTDEGMLGYVQPVGGEPGKAWPDLTEVYGIGAFLSAGSEVYKMVGGEVQVPEKDKAALTIFMKDGGWCWYQDPRAIIHDGKLFMGTVKGNGSGPALVGVYDLKAGKQLGTVMMQDAFDRDDHNSPVFHVRPDGSVLATYAKHNRDRFHYSRISDPADPLMWSDEFKHERNAPNPVDKVTYMNLYELKNEGKLYNFYRNIDFNPTFVTSTDHGETWGEPVHFFQNEVGGRHRPYARYAGNGTDTISVSITDAHPRNYGNNIYYFEFRAGSFYKADGTLIKSLQDGPLLPSEAEMIYRGSETKEKPDGFESVPNSAWTSSNAIDANGYPHIAYTLYLSNTDHRYRIASWDGNKWNDREVAFSGKCLYTKESSYTGLITLDPTDPTRVVISSDVDPNTGADLGGKHEIYVATVGSQDTTSSVQWKAITSDSKHRNLRPILVAGEGYKVLLWLNGTWNTYADYDVDVAGVIMEQP